MVSLRLRRKPPVADPSLVNPQVNPQVGATTTLLDDPAGTPLPGAVRAHGVGVLRALVQAAHPRYAVALAMGLAVAAACSGRALREVVLVAVTVLVGQTVLGWHNDLVDRGRDRAPASTQASTPGTASKPLADGRLESGTVWFAIACAVLLLVPLAVTNGVTAGSSYLLFVLVGVLGNVVLRTGLLSWVSWAVSFALLPAFLSYGGWGGQHDGDPPRLLMTVLVAMLGVGVHVVGSVWGLVPDDAAGWRTLPLRLGRRLGSSQLLVVAGGWTAVVLAAVVLAAITGGLAQ